MTTCEEIAAYAARADWRAISPEARGRLKQHLLDALGCALGALDAGPLAAILAEEEADACAGPCTLIRGRRATPERAAFYNGSLIRHLDFTDAFIAQEEACHPADNIAPLLSAAELSGASGKDFLTAMAVAYHIQCAITASGVPIMRRGLDHTFQLAVSAAAGTSRLLDLNVGRTAHAVALCATEGLSLGAARSGAHAPEWKGLAAPAAAFSVIHNVRLAGHGVTGPLHAFEGPRGVQQVLGRPLRIDWGGESYDGVLACSMKRFDAGLHAQPVIEGVLELRAGGLRAEQVRSIDIDIFKAGYAMTGGGRRLNPLSAETGGDAGHSLPYLAAAALLDGDVQPAQFAAARAGASDIAALMPRIRAHGSRRYTREYPRWMHVKISVDRDGAPPLSIEKRDYEGFFRRPMPWPGVIAKFERLSAAVPADARARIVECVMHLESRSMDDLFAAVADALLAAC